MPGYIDEETALHFRVGPHSAKPEIEDPVLPPPSTRAVPVAVAPRPLPGRLPPPPPPPSSTAQAGATWRGFSPEIARALLPPGELKSTLQGLPLPHFPPSTPSMPGSAPISLGDADLESWHDGEPSPPVPLPYAPPPPFQRGPMATTQESTPSPPSMRRFSSRPPPPPPMAIPPQPPIPAPRGQQAAPPAPPPGAYREPPAPTYEPSNPSWDAPLPSAPSVSAGAAGPAPSARFVSPAEMIAPAQPGFAVLAAYVDGRRVVIDKTRFVIGRNSLSCDLAIKDTKISRQHAMVEYLSGRYYIVDMGSTNGVEFRGQRVGRKAIYEGDVFRICTHDIRFSFR